MSAHGDHDHDEHDHHHGHGHGDHHRHDHQHGHHLHAPAPASIERGAGRGKVLFLDAFSGIAGDMTIAALLDLGVPLSCVEAAVAALPLQGFHLHVGHVHRSGIVATTFDVHVEARQPERTYRSIREMLDDRRLDPAIASRAKSIFQRLGEAEAAVHQTPIDDVHFHEVGAVDAIVDIVGAAACIEWLGAEVVASPLPMGHGFVSARHGVLPLPAPATVSCLRGVPTYAVDLEAELVTPTGAAIVASTASSFVRWPSMVPERVGWGGGRRELPDRPNLLRAVLGSAVEASEPRGSAASGHADYVVVEANVDDMTGELAAHALGALLDAGAVDAWAVPIVMKKGRPGLVLSALARAEIADAVGATLLRETTSIGVRKTAASRIERPRRTFEVNTPFGAIPIKSSEGPYGPPQLKPEFDACARAAKAAGVPVREVVAAALAAARDATADPPR